MVDPVWPADFYLIQRRAAQILERKAMPNQPSLGCDRLYATLARGGL